MSFSFLKAVIQNTIDDISDKVEKEINDKKDSVMKAFTLDKKTKAPNNMESN